MRYRRQWRRCCQHSDILRCPSEEGMRGKGDKLFSARNEFSAKLVQRIQAVRNVTLSSRVIAYRRFELDP